MAEGGAHLPQHTWGQGSVCSSATLHNPSCTCTRLSLCPSSKSLPCWCCHIFWASEWIFAHWACRLTPLHSTHPAKPSSNRQLMYHAVSSQFIWSNVTLQAQPWVCRKVWQSRFKIEKWKFSPVSFMIMNVKTYSRKQVCVCIHSVKPPIDFYGETVAEIFREAFIFSLIFSLSSG